MGASINRRLKLRLLLALTLLAHGPSLVRAQSFGSSSSNSNVGYIDTAIVANRFSLRFDAAYDNDVPDRAEFFYAKCGCFRVFKGDPNAPGPPKLETSVDYQTIQADVEFLLAERLSALMEVPVRFINPEQNDNNQGFGDLQVGFKYALHADPDELLTFQFRTYVPTGNAFEGLGTNHVSLEPAVLYRNRWTDRLTFEAEFRDWIPISGSSSQGTPFFEENFFAGNVIRYGVGLGYDLYNDGYQRFTPVVEFVGWTVLDGLSSRSNDGVNGIIEDAAGDTIVNAKLGARISTRNGGSIYAGYGRALTGDVWYQDIFRIEYRQFF